MGAIVVSIAVYVKEHDDWRSVALSTAAAGRLLQTRRRLFDGFHNLHVPRAHAEVARKVAPYLLFARVRVAHQQRVARHHEAGSTETALKAELGHERILEGVQASVAGKPFNSGDSPIVCLNGEHEARLHEHTVNEHRTRTAFADHAADVRSCEARMVAQELHQQCSRLDVAFVYFSVDG